MLEWILEQFLEKILGRKFWPCELNPCAVRLCGTKFKMAGRERRVLDGMWFHYSAAGIHPEPLLCCVSPPPALSLALAPSPGSAVTEPIRVSASAPSALICLHAPPFICSIKRTAAVQWRRTHCHSPCCRFGLFRFSTPPNSRGNRTD